MARTLHHVSRCVSASPRPGLPARVRLEVGARPAAPCAPAWSPPATLRAWPIRRTRALLTGPGVLLPGTPGDVAPLDAMRVLPTLASRPCGQCRGTMRPRSASAPRGEESSASVVRPWLARASGPIVVVALIVLAEVFARRTGDVPGLGA